MRAALKHLTVKFGFCVFFLWTAIAFAQDSGEKPAALIGPPVPIQNEAQGKESSVKSETDIPPQDQLPANEQIPPQDQVPVTQDQVPEQDRPTGPEKTVPKEVVRPQDKSGPADTGETVKTTQPVIDKGNLEVASILERHCARCHQVGKLSGQYDGRPQGKFGYLLDFGKLQETGLVRAGQPDGSPLYNTIVSRSMPPDIASACHGADGAAAGEDTYCGPDKNEIAALKSWIEKLRVKKSAAPKTFVAESQMLSDLAQDIARQPASKRRQYRYLSLTHLHNAGDSASAIDSYAQALTKLVNSLSFKSDPVKLVPVDAAKTLFRVNITKLGWDQKKWDQLSRLNPYAVYYDDANFRTVQQETKAQLPFIRGDWFAFAASQPPLYYDLLGLPTTKRQLEQMLGLNVRENLNNLDAARAGFQKSGISDANRLIERHTSRTGVYWQSYDFASNQGRKSIFQFPLGMDGAGGAIAGEYGFSHDGNLIIFGLPNGFHGYFIADGKGNRLNKAPTHVIADRSRRDLTVTAGISCLSCHDKGIKFNDNRPHNALDQVRTYAKTALSLPSRVQETLNNLYPEPEEFHRLMLSDAKRYADALSGAGVDVKTKINGEELINGLVKRFGRNLTLNLAAAELGMSVEAFEEGANKAGGDYYALKQRLLNDLVPRDQFVSEFAKIINKMTANKAVGFEKVTLDSRTKTQLETSRPSNVTKTFDLAFYPKGNNFVKGKAVEFYLKTEKPCYLTLINKDDTNKAAVIYPNKFAQNNAVQAGRTYKIPGGNIKGFKFKFLKEGRETLIAICNANRPDPAGIRHDFSKNTYTLLNYDASFIERMLADRARNRLILSRQSGGTKAPLLETEREKKMRPLIKNGIDPHVDIEARKTIILNVKAK